MLKRITFSGIDPSVSPEALKALHAEFPFVEFAFLFTESRKAAPATRCP